MKTIHNSADECKGKAVNKSRRERDLLAQIEALRAEKEAARLGLRDSNKILRQNLSAEDKVALIRSRLGLTDGGAS